MDDPRSMLERVLDELWGRVDARFRGEERRPLVLELHAAGRVLGEDVPEVDWIRADARGEEGIALVGLCHEIAPLPEPPDVVLSVDGLQHDPVWGATVRRAVDLVRLGGVIALAWHSPEAPSEPDGTSPAVNGFEAGTYRAGLSVSAVLGALCGAAFRSGRDVGDVATFSLPGARGLVAEVLPAPHPMAGS